MSAPTWTQQQVDEINRDWAAENDILRWRNGDLQRQMQQRSHELAQEMARTAELRCELRQFRNLRGVEG